MDGNPFAGPHFRTVHHAMIRGHKPTAHRRALEKSHAIGHMDQIQVGIRQADVRTVAAVIGYAGNQRRIADIGISGAAEFTRAVALAERNQHAIALLEVLDLFAYLFDYAAEFVTHNHGHRRREPDPRPVAGPQVPVGAADALGGGLDDSAIGWTLR